MKNLIVSFVRDSKALFKTKEMLYIMGLVMITTILGQIPSNSNEIIIIFCSSYIVSMFFFVALGLRLHQRYQPNWLYWLSVVSAWYIVLWLLAFFVSVAPF